jgi:hypothetical protein
MSDNDIKILIGKYFDGLTSLDEEQQLRDYFQQENVSSELEIYMPMFRHFTSEKAAMAKRNIKIIILRRSIIAAAACLLLFISLRWLWNVDGIFSEISQAYIDGKEYTDIELIRTETLKSLDNLSIGSNEAYSSQVEALKCFIK